MKTKEPVGVVGQYFQNYVYTLLFGTLLVAPISTFTSFVVLVRHVSILPSGRFLTSSTNALNWRFISRKLLLAECQAAAEGFRSVSSGDAITNCVSVVDGLLVRIATPTKKEAKNVRSFFSGHYQAYGMNIQGACDYLSRFTFLGVAGPGVMADREAIEQVPLNGMILRYW